MAWALAWGSSTLKGFNMKTTVSVYDFREAFKRCGRGGQFSYDGLGVLFRYFEEYEQDTGEEIEMDVIGICCDFAENDFASIAEDYSIDLSECDSKDSIKTAVLDFLADNGSLIGETDEAAVYRQF